LILGFAGEEMLDLKPIKERLEKATPGPWAWREDDFRPKYMKQKRDGTWMARPGCRATDSWVMLLTGPARKPCADPIPENIMRGYPDEWDFPHIVALRWDQIKGKSLWNATPGPGDAKFIANAPTDIKALIEEVERLRGLVKDAGLPLTQPIDVGMDGEENQGGDLGGASGTT